MSKVTPEDIEGMKFAKKMDEAIAEIVATVQNNPELQNADARLMASCFISMSAQCVLNMDMSKKHWMDLCETIFDSHRFSRHANESSTSH